MSRFSLRAATPLLLGVAIATCSDQVTGTARSAPARLALLPQFAPQAAAIFRSLAAFDLAVDNVHIVVRRSVDEQLGTVLKDTTVSFPADASEIHVLIELGLAADEEQVTATVELSEGATTLFRGTQDVLARRGETTGEDAPVSLSYVGPGADAEFITLSLLEPTLMPSGSVQFKATAFTHLEKQTALPISWLSSDPTVATISSAGLVTSTGKVGTTTITAKGLNGLVGSTVLTVAAPTTLQIVSGDKQVNTVATVLTQPLVVTALAANGHVVVDAPITFSTSTPGATITPATARTDANGQAQATITLGAAVGTYTFGVEVTGQPNAKTTASATANSATPAALSIVAGNGVTQSVTTLLEGALIVAVKDALGNPVPGSSVHFHVASGVAHLYPDPLPDAAGVTDLDVVTGADGTARVRLQLGTLAGPIQVVASLPGSAVSPVTFSATAAPGDVAQLLIVRQPSTEVRAAEVLPQQPVVRLADRYGNFVAQAGTQVLAFESVDCSGTRCLKVARTPLPVSAARVAGTALGNPARAALAVSDTITRGVVGDVVETTDANGIATFKSLALNVYAGPYVLYFNVDDSFQSGPSNTINVTPNDPTDLIAQSGADTLLVSSGATFLPMVQVVDVVGNGIPGVAVTWKANAGILDSSSTTQKSGDAVTLTDQYGFANPGEWRLPTVIGEYYTITAAAASPTGKPLGGSPLSITVHVVQ